jgi:hypothetical protein
MHLYIKSLGSLEDVAHLVASAALQGWQSELREGLNLGGGEYFKFERPGAEVLLVCNDGDHPEVFIEERSQFPYYCYVWEGSDKVLEQMKAALDSRGVTCEMHEDT